MNDTLRRAAPRAGLAVLVLAAHAWTLHAMADARLGWGAADSAPARIDVAFVRELQPAAPPLAKPMLPAPRAPAVVQAAAASAPQGAASAAAQPPNPSAAPETLATPQVPDLAAAPATPISAAVEPPSPAPPAPDTPEPPAPAIAHAPLAPASSPSLLTAGSAPGQPTAAVADLGAAAAPPAAAAVSAAVVSFDWPPSTRLDYRLNGHYRGPVDGRARVEWLRQGSRYQVRLDSSAGGFFSRRVVSEGELSPAGLSPRRFVGEQSVLFGNTRRWSLAFGPERLTLPDGREVPTMTGVQDEASQFVQLTWLFTTQPQRLHAGGTVDMPLAISRRVALWTFDVRGSETLYLPFGAVDAFHVKPRRDADPGDMSAEIWIAPSLQYLPVRILIRQREHWVDLKLERAPLQAAEAVRTPG